MANTEIKLVNEGGIHVPSASSVAVVEGDTISFSTSDGSHVLLFFSPDATALLSPAPGKEFVLAAGETVTFEFTSSKPGAYSASFGTSSHHAPASFSSEIATILALEIMALRAAAMAPPAFSAGTGDTTKSGS
jgi:hypothetical protein